MLEYTLEQQLIDKGYANVCGVDEAGRGPLCGPVVTAAVILPCGLVIEGLNDSKKLTEKKREALFDVICEKAIAYSICYGTVEEINNTHILQATMNAMKTAITTLPVKADYALIDGNLAKDFPIPASPVVHGDAISPSIAFSISETPEIRPFSATIADLRLCPRVSVTQPHTTILFCALDSNAASSKNTLSPFNSFS